MPTNLVPVCGVLVAAALCTLAAPWLKRLYRRRFGAPEANAASPADLPELPVGAAAGPFATAGQICFAGGVVVVVVLLDRIPILTMPQGLPLGSVRLVDLGIMPLISANELVAMVAILVPWLRHRASSPRMPDRDCLTVYALAVGIALYQAFTISNCVAQANFGAMRSTHAPWLPPWVWLFAGGLLCLGLALVVTRVCGGHGFTVVLLATVLPRLATGLAHASKTLRDYADAPGVRAGAFLLPIVPLVLFGITAAGFLGERTLHLRRRDGVGTVRLPMPVALTGLLPLFFAANLIYLPLAFPAVRDTALPRVLGYGGPIFLALQAILAAGISYVYAVVLLPPGGFCRRLAQFGLAPTRGERDSEPDPVSFGRLLWTVQWPWLAVLLVNGWLPPVLWRVLELHSAFAFGTSLAAPLAALTGALLVQYHVRRRRWRPVYHHREMHEILVVRALLAERGIPAEIGWKEAYGALLGMFIGPLAGKCLYVPAERCVEAAGIVEEHQCSPMPRQEDCRTEGMPGRTPASYVSVASPARSRGPSAGARRHASAPAGSHRSARCPHSLRACSHGQPVRAGWPPDLGAVAASDRGRHPWPRRAAGPLRPAVPSGARAGPGGSRWWASRGEPSHPGRPVPRGWQPAWREPPGVRLVRRPCLRRPPRARHPTPQPRGRLTQAMSSVSS